MASPRPSLTLQVNCLAIRGAAVLLREVQGFCWRRQALRPLCASLIQPGRVGRPESQTLAGAGSQAAAMPRARPPPPAPPTEQKGASRPPSLATFLGALLPMSELDA